MSRASSYAVAKGRVNPATRLLALNLERRPKAVGSSLGRPGKHPSSPPLKVSSAPRASRSLPPVCLANRSSRSHSKRQLLVLPRPAVDCSHSLSSSSSSPRPSRLLRCSARPQHRTLSSLQEAVCSERSSHRQARLREAWELEHLRLAGVSSVPSLQPRLPASQVCSRRHRWAEAACSQLNRRHQQVGCSRLSQRRLPSPQEGASLQRQP